jgi:hypothetical protein
MSFDRVGTEQAPITPSQKSASNYSSIRFFRILNGRTVQEDPLARSQFSKLAHELSACFISVGVPSRRSRKNNVATVK